MKHNIKDALQIVVAILITGSTAYAMQPPVIHAPAKHVFNKNLSVKKAVVVSKVVNTATPAQSTPQSPQNAPQPTITWQDNPNNCTSNQWISADPPFSCIDKPVATVATTISSGCGDNFYANYIFSHESGCRLTAVNAYSGDFGLGQSAGGLAGACPDWQTNYTCQNAFFNNYAISRYGSWANAYAFWVANSWW